MKMTMDQITAAYPNVAKLESQAGRELLAEMLEQMQALAAENAYLLNGAARELTTSWRFHKTMLGAQAALICVAQGDIKSARDWLEGTTDEAGADMPDDITVAGLQEWFYSQMVSNDGKSGFLTRQQAEEALKAECPSTDRFLAEVKREAVSEMEKEIIQLRAMSIGDLRDLIGYNPGSGKLTAKVNFSCRQAGSVIGSTTKHGYCVLSLFGKKYFAHRLAWLLHYGELPDMAIDHINGVKTDNRIENLRLCTLSQNQFNRPTQKNNSTGVKGVYWNKRDKRYVASVQFNGKKHSAGRHKDIGAAKQAVIDLREQLAGEFANHGEYELAQHLRGEKA